MRINNVTLVVLYFSDIYIYKCVHITLAYLSFYVYSHPSRYVYISLNQPDKDSCNI